MEPDTDRTTRLFQLNKLIGLVAIVIHMEAVNAQPLYAAIHRIRQQRLRLPYRPCLFLPLSFHFPLSVYFCIPHMSSSRVSCILCKSLAES